MLKGVSTILGEDGILWQGNNKVEVMRLKVSVVDQEQQALALVLEPLLLPPVPAHV